MADIYEGAYLTVVAAAGPDANHGLTGLNGVSGPRFFPPDLGDNHYRRCMQASQLSWVSGWPLICGCRGHLTELDVLYRSTPGVGPFNRSYSLDASSSSARTSLSGNAVAASDMNPREIAGFVLPGTLVAVIDGSKTGS